MDFDEFYLGCRDRVVLHVAALTGDPAEALDHVQEAFVKAWTRWDRIADFDADQRDLLEALAQLPTREREAVVLHHLVGYSVDEISSQLSAPSGTVKSWLSRGRAKLAAALSTPEVADEFR